MKKLLSIVLVLSMLFSLGAPLAVSADETENNTTSSQGAIYSNGKIWFNLNGNSRLFVPSTDEAITNRANYTGYLPGVDFAGYLGTPTGNFATDQAAVINSTYGGAMFVYNAGGSTSYINLTTDEAGNYYWAVNDENYLVRPQQNILKFVNQTVSTSSLIDNEMISRYQSLNGEQTIDVPDKKYSSIGFLGGAQLKYSKQIRVTLVYGDEEVAYGNVTHKYAKTTVSGTDGTIYMRNFTHSNNLYDAAYDFQVQTITTDPTKVLTAIKVYDVGLNGSSNAGNQSWPYYIISAWGVEKEVSLEELITELSALNASGIKNNASYSTIKAKIAEIDTYLTENSQTLTDEQKAVYDTTTALIKAYEESSASSNDSLKANISLAFNGNSKLFMDSTSTDFTNRATLTNYLPGLDYGGRIVNPTGNFATDLAALDLRSGCEMLGCLPYVLDSTSVSNSKNVAYFTTKGGNVYWTIDDVDYLVKPNEKVIKLVPGVQTTSVSASETLTAADKTNYSALAKSTIDVPDGKYEKISFLASIFGTYNRYITIKFIYEDSEVEIQQKIEAKNRSSAGTYYSKEGGLYFPRMNDASASLAKDDWHTFVPYEFTTDASKILKSIEITPSNDYWNYNNNVITPSTYTYPIFVISMWAEQTIEGALSAITAKSSYEDALAAVTTVDKILAENYLTTSNISASTKLNYDLAKSIVSGAADIFELSIKQANEAMSKITANSSLEEAKAAEKLYLDTLSIEGIEEDDFDTAIVASFYDAYLAIRQKIDLTAEVKTEYYTGALPVAKITVNNIAELAGKKFALVLAYFDKDGNQIAIHTKDYTTTEEIQQKITFTPEKAVEDAVAVKTMVWESFSNMKPISETDYTERTEKRTYMFVGDSITHADQYPTYTESFFMTRFPNQVAEFVNAGRAGGTASGAVNKRYEWDIKPNDATHAVIMFGMNDIGRTNYGEGNEEITANKQVTIDKCVDNISKLAELLETEGANITLMTPSIYDEREYSTTTNLIGANTALGKVAEGAKNLATLKNYSVVDNHSLMSTINALYETSGVAEMIGSDRVHPNAQGAYVIAYNVIKTLFPDSGLVSYVDINAINKSANAENAEIEDLVASTNGITYTYIPKALPWAATDAYTKADGKYVNLTDELNREIIKATGLEDGTYTLKIDGETIGQYTNTELAQGINIAINAKNPGQIQAKEVYNLNAHKHENVLKLRNMAYVEYSIRSKGVYGDETAAKEYLSTIPSSTYLYEYYANYYNYLPSVPTWKENVEKYTEQAREKAIPATHKVEIVK